MSDRVTEANFCSNFIQTRCRVPINVPQPGIHMWLVLNSVVCCTFATKLGTMLHAGKHFGGLQATRVV